jgi:hypothetical protein
VRVTAGSHPATSGTRASSAKNEGLVAGEERPLCTSNLDSAPKPILPHLPARLLYAYFTEVMLSDSLEELETVGSEPSSRRSLENSFNANRSYGPLAEDRCAASTPFSRNKVQIQPMKVRTRKGYAKNGSGDVVGSNCAPQKVRWTAGRHRWVLVLEVRSRQEVGTDRVPEGG